LREKEASEAHLRAASKDLAHDDSQTQSQIAQLIGMAPALGAGRQPGLAQIALWTVPLRVPYSGGGRKQRHKACLSPLYVEDKPRSFV
jgi:hypothetical protein